MIGTRAIIAILIGTVIGASLFAVIGSFSGHGLIGCVVGSAVGVGVSFGTWMGRLSVPTAGGIVGAVVGAALGTGCDDYSGMVAVPGFFVGMLLTKMVRAAVRWLGLRSVFLLPCVVTGMIAIGTGSAFWGLAFLFLGLLTLSWDPDYQTTPLSPRTRRRREPPPDNATRGGAAD